MLAFAFAKAVYIARGEHDPQASIPSRQQILDSFSREIFFGSRLKIRKPNAVERKQARRRSEPQISVAGLRYGYDISGSAVLFSPHGMGELSDGLLRGERERSRGKQRHGKQTDDQPNAARCAPLTCSRDVRCNRGFKQVQVHGERSNRSPSNVPQRDAPTSYLSLSLPSISLGALSTVLQIGNGRYAFSASSATGHQRPQTCGSLAMGTLTARCRLRRKWSMLVAGSHVEPVIHVAMAAFYDVLGEDYRGARREVGTVDLMLRKE